jgi:hypothetical protein
MNPACRLIINTRRCFSDVMSKAHGQETIETTPYSAVTANY